MQPKRGGRTRLARRRWLGHALAGLASVTLGGLVDWRARASHTTEYGIVGQTAPELDVDYWIDEHGKPTNFSVTQARGKWVYLKCFQNWCPGCHAHGFPTLKRVADAFYGNDGIVIVGLQTVFEGFSVNIQAAVRKLQLRYALPITMGHDPGDPRGDPFPSTMRSYRTGGTPWMILIDPAGQVVFNDYGIDAGELIGFLHKQLA